MSAHAIAERAKRMCARFGHVPPRYGDTFPAWRRRHGVPRMEWCPRCNTTYNHERPRPEALSSRGASGERKEDAV
jgi:hypothetical protein